MVDLQDVAENPTRGFLVDLNSAAEFEFPMNPDKLQEVISVNWKRQGVLGLSHPVLQFAGTGSHSLPGVEFFVDRYRMAREQGSPVTAIEFFAFKRFLQSLTVPPRGAESIAGGAPPQVLFIWPEIVSLVCIVENVAITHQRFAHDGSGLAYRARITFSEIRESRVTSEEIFNDGSQRAGEFI